jgi:octaprenyl-diphosphate synthase
MGDYLYSRSVSELAKFGRVDLISVLAGAANEMSVGELRQLASHDALAFTEHDYDRLIASKTASLMSAACEMGAIAGRPEFREPLARYGHALGMAFQIADDLLDYNEVEAVTGKPSGQDLREHKVTLPLIHALGVMDADSRRTVERFFAQPVADDDTIRDIIGMVERSGGLDYALQRAERFGAQAAAALEALPAEPPVETLREAVAYVTERRR